LYKGAILSDHSGSCEPGAAIIRLAGGHDRQQVFITVIYQRSDRTHKSTRVLYIKGMSGREIDLECQALTPEESFPWIASDPLPPLERRLFSSNLTAAPFHMVCRPENKAAITTLILPLY